jgi:hypothetical protein
MVRGLHPVADVAGGELAVPLRGVLRAARVRDITRP